MLLRLGQNGAGVGWADLAFIVDRPKQVAGPFDLVEEANGLRRIALKVQFEDDGGAREAAQCLLHAFPHQGLGAFGVDLYDVQAGPVGAKAVEGDRGCLDSTVMPVSRLPVQVKLMISWPSALTRLV